MKSVLFLLLGTVIGGLAGWYMYVLGDGEVRAFARFSFSDKLNDPKASYLSAVGTWRDLTWPTRSILFKSGATSQRGIAKWCRPTCPR